MKILESALVGALAVAVAFDISLNKASAFVPSSIPRNLAVATKQRAFARGSTAGKPSASLQKRSRPSVRSSSTTLRMANEDFNESKYTEAAWSAVASITKVADFYEATTVEAPLLLEVMLNPVKHSAGEDAEAAKRVVEKILSNAGVDVTQLRSELDKYLSKQPRLSGDGSGSAQKSLGRTLQKVLDFARQEKSVLGVSLKVSLVIL